MLSPPFRRLSHVVSASPPTYRNCLHFLQLSPSLSHKHSTNFAFWDTFSLHIYFTFGKKNLLHITSVHVTMGSVWFKKKKKRVSRHPCQNWVRILCSNIIFISATATVTVRSTPTSHFSPRVQKKDRVRPKYQCPTSRRTCFWRVSVSGALPTRGSAAPTRVRASYQHPKTDRNLRERTSEPLLRCVLISSP